MQTAYVFFNTSRENDYKGYLETAADWCFTPFRVAFNGRVVVVRHEDCCRGLHPVQILTKWYSHESLRPPTSSDFSLSDSSLTRIPQNGIDADSSAGLGLLAILGIVPGTLLKGAALLIDSQAREDHYTLVSEYNRL